MTTLFLGTHEISWLARFAHPLFVSRRRFARQKKWPRSRVPWALDSGGFSELSLFGAWKTPAETYVAEVRRMVDEVGLLEWAAIQDWMCEPFMVAKTGLTIDEHQRRTVASYDQLRNLAPEIPWAPVLQGWHIDDYRVHVEMYARAGYTLRDAPVVGLGSVCRRQHTDDAEKLIRELTSEGFRLHGFGFKMKGLTRTWGILQSADSLAWSYNARKNPPLAGCLHKSCANCDRWALLWLSDVHRKLTGEDYWSTRPHS